MKVFLGAVCLLLLAAFCSEGLAAPLGADVPAFCCPLYAPRKIPQRNIQDYVYVYSSRCSKPAVIFTTVKGRKVCANPKQAWVQNCINHLDRK